MPGDYTRLTFDPLKDRAMLLEQQGRVHLDANFNEAAALFERRLRVESRDILGPAVYPAIEPNSFKLEGAPGGPWTIGRGRMYVDGLLAENHGAGPVGYEPVWDEPRRSEDTPVEEQPYAGTPQDPPIGAAADELVYLDVWQRELTCVEDPSVLEPALGVDTATRVQTAWQVRSLELDGDGMDCGGPWDKLKAWQQLVRPSAARLSSAATQAPDPADPCAVAPVGGYRGLENRLYRVEIHDGGAPGEATLKWSRDNGAVASRITALTGEATIPIVTVERLGRDEVLRFHAGEWVELLDDVLELDRRPGLMGQVLETDQTQSTVTLTAPLDGPIDLGRNPRLRRWDQRAGVDAGGVIAIASSPQTIDLEDGIEVTIRIDGADSAAHVGDWWVFAARAASASIEELDQAPPRGVRHHFARLAVIHGGHVSDCRIPWPGECDCEGGDCGCTRCVTPASHQDGNGPLTIQAAIDAVLPQGGRVCLAPGRYRLQQPLRITAAHGLTLAGDGLATVIEAPQALGVLVEDSIEVSLERLAVVAAPEGHAAAGFGIALVNTVDCRVERCFVTAGAIAGSTGIALAGIALRTRLRENVILAGCAIGDAVAGEKVELDGHVPATFLPPHGGGEAAPADVLGASTPYLVTVDLAIEDNLLLGMVFGVRFGATALAASAVHAVLTIHAAATRIARNLVLGGGSAGLALLGLTAQSAPPAQAGQELDGLAKLASAALLRLARVDVRENLLAVTGDGIRATLEELVVDGNALHGPGAATRGTGIGVHLGGFSAAGAGATTRIAGNTIVDQPDCAVLIVGGDGGADVSGNWIARTGLGGIGVRGRLEVGDVRVAGNLLEQIAVRADPADDTALWGIEVAAAADAVVSDNVLRGFAPDRGPVTRTAIRVEVVDVLHVDGNQLLGLGPPEGTYAGDVTGIFVGAGAAADVRGNTVRIVAGGERPRSAALLIGAAGAGGKLDPLAALPGTSAHGLLWAHLGAKQAAEPVEPGLPQVAVHGNTLHGGGEEPVARLGGTCNATFSENRCRWLPPRRTDPVVLIDVRGAAIVSANHVEGPDAGELPALVVRVDAGGAGPHATVLGNIVHGPIELNGGALPPPWAAININA